MTRSPEETRALGSSLASALLPGDVVLLHGDLGAGKSEFTRGIARGLGISGPVSSPSFTILNLYDRGRVKLYHFDWYRLESPEELYELGMDEYLGGDGVAVVEWPDRCPEAIPPCRLDIQIRPGPDENSRIFVFIPSPGFHPLDSDLIRPSDL